MPRVTFEKSAMVKAIVDFISNLNKRGKVAPSQASLAKQFGVSQSFISTTLRALQDQGDLLIQPPSQGGLIVIRKSREYSKGTLTDLFQEANAFCAVESILDLATPPILINFQRTTEKSSKPPLTEHLNQGRRPSRRRPDLT